MADPALRVDVRERRFRSADGRDVHAIGQLAFELERDSFTCIVGPSGCGKTTTLRLVLGLDTGHDGTVQRTDRGRVAAVFQEPRLLPWRSVDDNVRLALPRGMEPALDELFATLGLSEHRSLFPGELSLGLARRAALARAFAVEPALLLLDEPFVSLDETTAARLRALLIDVWRARPTTALMVTHDVAEAVELADRVLVFAPAPTRVLASIDLSRARDARDAAWRREAIAEVRGAAGVMA